MSDEDDVERLRRALHDSVDQLFSGLQYGIQVEQAALQLAGRLIVAAQPWIDRQIGRDLSDAAVKNADAAERLGAEKRGLVKAARYSVDGQSPEVTADIGLIGAAVIIRELAVFTDDPYLHHLAEALVRLRYGQPHPWLTPPKAAVHPRKLAQAVLQMREVPFAVIEYLVTSGAYARKTDAAAAVLERLGIEKDGLDRWRKQQNRARRNDFHTTLWSARSVGQGIRPYRSQAASKPALQAYVAQHDELYGLAAVERCAAALERAGADRGKRRR